MTTTMSIGEVCTTHPKAIQRGAVKVAKATVNGGVVERRDTFKQIVIMPQAEKGKAKGWSNAIKGAKGGKSNWYNGGVGKGGWNNGKGWKILMLSFKFIVDMLLHIVIIKLVMKKDFLIFKHFMVSVSINKRIPRSMIRN